MSKVLRQKRRELIYQLAKRLGTRKNTLTLMKDVRYFTEDICDLVLIGQPISVEHAVHLINSHFDLESRISGEKKIIYSVGSGKLIFQNESKIS